MKKKLIISSIAAILLFVASTTYYSNVKTSNIAKEQVMANQKRNFIDKKTAEQINRKFYSHQKIQQGSEMAFVNYPTTFSKMVDSGQLTIIGEVTGLKSFVANNLPYTIANMGVKKVLHGDNSQLGKVIRVMFLGGNISQKELLAPVSDKKFMNMSNEEITSDKIVTVEYSNNRLPKAGDKIAMVLSKTPAGTNNIPGEFWMAHFANKSVFFQDDDGQYRRTPEAKSIGGGSSGKNNFSQNDWNQQDDEKMNDGMNKLILSQK